MMKTVYSEEYYKSEGHRLDGKKGIIDLEANLKHELEIFVGILPKDAIEKITSIYAKKVADEAKARLLEDKKLYIAVQKDRNCLGYTTINQAVAAAREITIAFEYNCYKLLQFKKKYNII